uniref:Uncharacterized protein n=1 Tax=Arundo donax TaxID=35708 RepID=A0A0A9EUZ1_ARUDO
MFKIKASNNTLKKSIHEKKIKCFLRLLVETFEE